MIKLTKIEEPDVLKKYKKTWTKRYINAIKKGKKVGSEYTHKDIKDALIYETNKKCVYCESKFIHTYPGDVEHLLPKSVLPKLTFEWTNLSFSCFECNNCKGNYYDRKRQLINPYNEDPRDYLFAFGPIIWSKGNSDKGEITLLVIDLNRESLILKRTERIKNLKPLIKEWGGETDPGYKKILRKELLKEIYKNKEYVMIVTDLLNNFSII